jgi:hypothetical protein
MWRLQECGLALLGKSSLPEHLVLPPVVASLDVLLVCGQQKLAAIEVKCPFSFRDEGEGSYLYLGCKQYAALPARVYAHC